MFVCINYKDFIVLLYNLHKQLGLQSNNVSLADVTGTLLVFHYIAR